MQGCCVAVLICMAAVAATRGFRCHSQRLPLLHKMSHIKDDPRDPSLEVPLTFPKTWYQESSEGLNTSGMFLSGLIMVTRNRFLAWPAILFSLNSHFNQHPARQKGDTGSWSNLMLCISALVASYIPVMIVTRNPVAAPTA